MKISELIWLQQIVDKLEAKHKITLEEVEEVFSNRPEFRFIEDGNIAGENVYAAYGQTDAGRYVTTIFILKPRGHALIITARDMDRKERRRYGK